MARNDEEKKKKKALEKQNQMMKTHIGKTTTTTKRERAKSFILSLSKFNIHSMFFYIEERDTNRERL